MANENPQVWSHRAFDETGYSDNPAYLNRFTIVSSFSVDGEAMLTASQEGRPEPLTIFTEYFNNAFVPVQG